MADATGHIRVETIIDQSLQAGLNSLSASIGATTGRITALNSVSRRLSESSRGVNASLKVLGETERGVHSITQALAVSQTTLANHFAQVRRETNAFNAVLRSNSSASKANASAISNNVAKIRQMNAAQATLNQTMRAGAMMNMSRQYNKQATELSYVGQRLTMGLTLPLMAVGRLGFSSLKKLDQEMTRTRKLLNDTGTDAKFLENQMKVLGDRLDEISFKWGVSRELLQGLAGDFAELGISSPEVLANLVQITNEIEKLGNVDMTEANDLTRSIYQNLLKLRRVNDQDVTSDAALKTVTSQVRGAIALFNFAENKTSLSLKDIAQAFPEVQAAATTFGLSMQTTAALLVPMVSAGIKTGTAANALKVSLQKLIIPTKMTRDLYAGLNKELGPNFKTSMDIGTKGIQDLVDSFIELEKSAYGTQGTLQLFARAFGVRQGTRMDLSIQQLAAFQKQIEKTDEAVKAFDGTMGDSFNPNARGSVESQLLSSLEKEINAQLRLAKIDEIRIRNIKEIGDINEMATETQIGKDIYGKEVDVFTERAKAVQKAQEKMLDTEEKRKKVNQQINQISTESGKILIGGAIGQGLMAQTMEDELKAVEGTLNVQAGKVREAFKSIARDATVAFGSVLTTVGPALQKIAIFVKDLSPGTKKLIGFFALFLLAIGPLVRVFSLFKQAAGLATFGMAKGMIVGRSRAMELNEELLRVNNTFLKLGKKNTVSEIGGKLVFTGKQKVFDRAQQLSALQASQASRDPDARGLGARIESSKIRNLERRLGISSKTEANFAGLKPETTSTLKGLYASQVALAEAAKKAAIATQNAAQQNKPTVMGQMFGNNNPLKGIQVATTKALDLIKTQSLTSPQTLLKKANASVAAATQKASAKVSADPFMKTILNAIKSLLQEIAKCTCAKSPLAAGKNAPALGAVSSRGSPGTSGNGSASTGVTVNPVVAASAGKTNQQIIAEQIKRMRDATAAQNAKNAAVIANLQTQQPVTQTRTGGAGGMFGMPSNLLAGLQATIAKAAQPVKTPAGGTGGMFGMPANMLAGLQSAMVKAQQPITRTPSGGSGGMFGMPSNLLAALQAATARAVQPLTQTPAGGTGGMFGMPTNLLAGLQSAMAKAIKPIQQVATKPAETTAATTGRRRGRTLEDLEAEKAAKAKAKEEREAAKAKADADKKTAQDAAKAKAKVEREAAKQAAKVERKTAPVVDIQDKLRKIIGTEMFRGIKDMGFNMSKAKIGRDNQPSFELNKRQLLGMFKEAEQAVPNELKQVAELIDSRGRVLRISLDQMIKLFEGISAGKFASGAKALTRAGVTEMIPGASTSLNELLRKISGGSTRVAPGTGTYVDLRREGGGEPRLSARRGYQETYNANPMDPRNLGSLIPRTGRIGMNARQIEEPDIPIDSKANTLRANAMLAGFPRIRKDKNPSHIYSGLRRTESTVLPGRLEELLQRPVGFKTVKVGEEERKIPTNVSRMPTRNYQVFARTRAKQIDLARSVGEAAKNLDKQRSAIAEDLKSKGASAKDIVNALKGKGLGRSQIKTTLSDVAMAPTRRVRSALVAKTAIGVEETGFGKAGGVATGLVPTRNIDNTEVGNRVKQAVSRVAKEISEERAGIVKDLRSQGASAKEVVNALKQAGLSRRMISRTLSSVAATARPGAEKEVMANLGDRLDTARRAYSDGTKTGSSKESLATAEAVLKKDLAPLLKKEKQDKKMTKEGKAYESKLAEERQKVKQLTDSQPARLAEISKIESITAKARTDEQKKLLKALKKEQNDLPKARVALANTEARGKVLKQYKFMSAAETTELAQKKKALEATSKMLKEVTASKGLDEAKKKVAEAEAAVRKSGLSQEQQDRLLNRQLAPTPAPAPKSTGVLAGMGYLPQPRDIVGTSATEKPKNALPPISDAQKAVNEATARLANLQSVKTALKQPPNPYASEADVKKVKTDLEAKLKALKLGKESLDSAIQKAQATLVEAKQKLATSLAPKAGGGGVGGTSMVMGPMLGMTGPMLGARAGLVEKFGPKMPTMTAGSTAGSSSTVFAEIQKALNIPGDVMKQVKDSLTNGFTNAEGVVRGAQNQVVNVGNASTGEIKAGLGKLIEALKSVLGTVNTDVVAISEAIRNVKLGSLETAAIKPRRTGEAPAAVAATPVVSETKAAVSKTTNIFTAQDKAIAAQVQQIANTLLNHNIELQELLKLDDRTIRKVVETLAKTNENFKGVAKLGQEEKARALVKHLGDNQKSFVTYQELLSRVTLTSTQAARTAATAVKTQGDASSNSLKAATATIDATNQSSDVNVEGITRASANLKAAVVKTVSHPLAILAQVAQAIVAQQAALPSVTAVAPVANQVPGAVKVLDNAAADHVAKLAEMMRRAAGQLSGTPLGFAGAQQLVQGLKSTTSGAVSGRRPPPANPLSPGQAIPTNLAPAIAKFNIKASQIAANLAKINPRSVLATVAPASVATQRAGAMMEASRPGIANYGLPVRTPAFDPSGVLGQIRSVVNKSLILPPKVASIADIPIPKRGSARSYDIPEPPKFDKLTKLNSFVGKLVAITSRVTSSRAAQVLDAGGAGLMPGLTALKPGLLAPLFQRQNRFVPTDYYGAAKERMSQAQIRRGVDPTTPRQVRNIQKEASREGAVMRGIDRPNELVRMMQGRLPSQFIQSVSPMVDKFRAIGSVFAPRIYKASLMAEMHLKKTAVVGGRVAKEMVKFPLTANVAIGRAAQIVTTALTPSVRTLADSLRSVGTKISGAVQKGFIASGVAESSPKAARVLEVAGKTLSFSVQTAFSMVAGSLNLAAMIIQSPRQALSQGIAGITGAFTRTATAVKGSIAKLAAAGGGGPLGFAKAATMGVAKGAFSLAAKPVKAVGSAIASQVRQSRPYMAMMGGPVVKADDGTASKKGGFFTASKTYDAQGAVTSKSGGFAKNMAAVPFNAIAGGMRMVGGATSMAVGSVSSLANMMLYKLGPAGFLLMPILSKVTAGLTAMGAKALLIILPLLAIFAVFKVVKKGWESFSKYAGDAAKNFEAVKEVFKTIVDTIKSIFFDFFATLTGANKEASASTPEFGDTKTIAGMKKMGASIQKFSEELLKFANAFKKIFDKYIAPFIYQVLSGFALVLKGVVDVFMSIFNVVKGIYQKIKGEGDNGTGALKAGWEKLKSGVLLVLKGILKMFIGILIPIVNAVFKFVELVVQLFEFLGFAIVNIMRYIAKTIISVVTGFVSVFAFVIDKIIEVWVFLQTSIVVIYREILKGGVNVAAGLVKGFIWGVQKILDAFAALLVGVGDLLGIIPGMVGAVFQNIADKIKGLSVFGVNIGKYIAPAFQAVADGFDFVVKGVDLVTGATKGALNGLLDPLSKGVDAGAAAIVGSINVAAETAKKVIGAIGTIGDKLRGKIADFGNAARDAVDGVADSTNAIIGSASDAINDARKFVTDWLQSFAKGDDIIEGMGKGAKDALDDAIKNTDPSALAAAGEDIAKAIQEGLKNVKMNFFEKVIDNLGKALEKQKSKLVDALNLQKDNQLKIFDDQIAAIDALAAAEEKLTATIEFENKKREAEAERALQRKNYEKQRALAIYEGRIDDARTLDQEETKNRKDAEKNLQDMQTERNKTLQGEQRDTAKTIIGQQKTKAAEAFDKDIKAFEEFAANVLSKGTFTKAELESQFAEISNKASEMSLDMRDSFSSFYTALPGLISANTEPTVGFFNTSLQALVDAAKAKFGLDAEVSGDTILGSTALMLNGSTAMFAEKMPLVLEEYKKGTDALAQVGIDWATPGNPNSPESIYGKAIADANAAMIREFMKMKTEAGSAFAEVVKEINSQIKDIAIADAIKAATEGLKKVGTGSGSDAGSGAGTPSPQTTTIAYPKTAAELGLDPTQTTLYNDAMSGAVLGSGGGFNPFATVSMERFNVEKSPAQNLSLVEFKKQVGGDGFIGAGNTAAYVSNIKKALKFYGYDAGSTDTLGISAIEKVAQFQAKYFISPADGKVRENTARALGLFSDPGTPKRYYGGAIKRMMGGPVGAYGAGGTVPGFAMKAVPALLHGGEYVVNAKAVQNLGSGFLQYINNLKNGMPRFGIPTPNMPNVNINQTVNVNGGNSENINNYNFYVDNFIGEDKWFEGMMNEYNVKVVPNKQKSAGLESRVVRSYNGINKGI